MLKRTSLYEEHKALGGRLIDFGGWELPVQYTGVMGEHLACRSAVGLFDVSHMGEVEVEGKDAEGFLNYLVTNNVAKIAVGQAQYTVMCNKSGGIVDDLIIYKRSEGRYLVVVNASNTEKDYAWMEQILSLYKANHLKVDGAKVPAVEMTNASSKYAQIAIQGRHAVDILQTLTEVPLAPVNNYWFVEGNVLGSIPAILARTGYTGEDGFEVYVPWDQGPIIWRALLSAGKGFGIKACGLGARDTLRLEMKYPLYGNELSDETNPLEAGLGWVVKLDKGDFVGRSPTAVLKLKGPSRQLVGIKLTERGIPRHGYPVLAAHSDTRIGELTSGTQSPSLKEAIGVAYVDKAHSSLGTRISVEIRGAPVAAEVVATPFYKRPY